MNAFRPDLLIKNGEGNPVAIIEVKSIVNMSKDRATEIRGNMLKNGLPSSIPYFLLLSQDEGYLWKSLDQPDPDALPLYHFPMSRIVQQYSLKKPDQRLYEQELELLVLHWLANLIANRQETTEEPEKTLAQAGFSESVENGIVLIEEGL